MRFDIQHWGEYVKVNATQEIVRLVAYDDSTATVDLAGNAVDFPISELSKLSEDEVERTERVVRAIRNFLEPKPQLGEKRPDQP